MSAITSGSPVNFVVRAFNNASPPQQVPDTNGPITVSLDNPAAGTVSVNADGTGGVFTPATPIVPGVVNVIATDSVLTSAPYPITVQNLTPAALVISAT